MKNDIKDNKKEENKIKKENKKRNIILNIIRVILIILLIMTFGIIFGFSSQDGEKSGGISKKITIAITNPIKSIQEKPIEEKEAIIERTESVIRKIAHFSIYTLVGFLLMLLFSTYKIKEFNRLSISLIIGIIYATLDEIHQSFIPERSASIFDVILDGQGVLFGICISLLIIKISLLMKDNNNTRNSKKRLEVTER